MQSRLRERPDSREVCFSKVEVHAIRWPAELLACKSIAKIYAKIDPKSVPGGSPGHPKSRQIRCRETPGTPRGAQERPEGVLGASRERPGASPARSGSARRVTKSAPGRQKGRPGAPGSAPRRPKSTPSRVRNKKFELSWHGSLADRFSVDFRPIFDRFSDVRARRSGSALAANFDRFSVRAREA